MPLSNNVYLGAHAPDNTAAGISIAKTRPDPYTAFSKGYDDAQRQTAQKIANDAALQNYRQTVIKADLANALYPDLLASQQAALRARLAGYNSPNPYASDTGGGPNPINTVPSTAGNRVAVRAAPTAPGDLNAPYGASGDSVANAVRNLQNTPAVSHPDNPFNSPSAPLFQSGPQAPVANTQMIPGVASNSPFDYTQGLAGSGFDAGDFLPT
jgi:hypothetical protein